MSSPSGTTINDEHGFIDPASGTTQDTATSADSADVATLAHEIEQLRDCFEELVEIVSGQPDHTDDIAMLMDRMAFFERRMHRAEDGLSDMSWALRRQPSEN